MSKKNVYNSDKEKNDLISVIMSSHDTRDEYLTRSVKSILEQTYKKVELIVIIDGGEYDGCLARIHDKRLKVVVHKKSLGLAKRLNEGILAAKGEFIARMDSDDISMPKRLEHQREYMISHPSIDICATFAKEFGDRGDFRINAYVSDEYIRSELFFNNVLIHPTVMFRKSSIKKYNIKYNEDFRYSQDYELWNNLPSDCKIAVIPEIGLMYRMHEKQASSKKREQQMEFYYKTIEGNLNRLGMDSDSAKYVKMLNGHYEINEKDLERFIRKCIVQNNIKRIYNTKAFRNTLYKHFLSFLWKNKYFTKGFRFLNWYSIWFIMRKTSLTYFCKIKFYINNSANNSIIKEKHDA